MKRSQLRDISMEVMVGAFMFMILLALGFFTIILSYENIFRQYHEVTVKFDHVSGLRQGDNVFLRGVMIGRVRSLIVENDRVEVTASLQRPVNMREGYRIEIIPSSVLGGQYLSIDEGPPDAPALPEDTVLYGRPPVDLIDEATSAVQAVRQSLDEGEVLHNLEAIMAQVNTITHQLSAGEGTLGRLLMEDEVYNELAQVTTNLRTVSEQLSTGQGTLGRLLMEDDVYNELEQLTANLRSVSEQMSTGQGTLGKLIADDELYEEAQLLMREVRAAIDDFRETAPITTFTSIFFGAF